MSVRQLGDAYVHAVVFGGMNLSIEGRPDRADAIATIHAARDAGCEVFDTADVYGLPNEPHHNEVLLREALGADARIITKGGVRRIGDQWEHHGRPEDLEAACERSLRTLGSIAIYQLHAVDENVPIEDSVGALARLRERGWFEHVGVSNVNLNQLRRAYATSPLASVQNEASPFVAPDPGVMKFCEDHDIAFLAYAPMGGWRAGKTAHLPALQRVAQTEQCTPFEAVVRWLLGVSPNLFPVCGASTPSKAVSSIQQFEELDADSAKALTRELWQPLRAR